jgi:hypothetical protein
MDARGPSARDSRATPNPWCRRESYRVLGQIRDKRVFQTCGLEVPIPFSWCGRDGTDIRGGQQEIGVLDVIGHVTDRLKRRNSKPAVCCRGHVVCCGGVRQVGTCAHARSSIVDCPGEDKNIAEFDERCWCCSEDLSQYTQQHSRDQEPSDLHSSITKVDLGFSEHISLIVFLAKSWRSVQGSRDSWDDHMSTSACVKTASHISGR